MSYRSWIGMFMKLMHHITAFSLTTDPLKLLLVLAG